MRHLSLYLLALSVLLLPVSCVRNKDSKMKAGSLIHESNAEKQQQTIEEDFENQQVKFDRLAILKQLRQKKQNNDTLLIHIFVPLCDNENQNIGKTTKSLGDGLNLKTNLYWAVKGSTKYDFVKDPRWKLMSSALNFNSDVLERIVFERTADSTKVYLIADAYRGDRMQQTMNDFLATIAQVRKDTFRTQDALAVQVKSPDLIIFNGHNGMLDSIVVQHWHNATGRKTDVVINACGTYYGFDDELVEAGGYPLIRTTGTLHPGAYVLTQIIDDWLAGVEADTMAVNADKAYCTVQKCKADRSLFVSGW